LTYTKLRNLTREPSINRFNKRADNKGAALNRNLNANIKDTTNNKIIRDALPLLAKKKNS
jgi:hypothetical protein